MSIMALHFNALVLRSRKAEETKSMSNKVVVCALYRFVDLPEYEQIREPLLQLMLQQDIKGTLLLAKEGINGTVSGSQQAIDCLLDWLRRDERFADMSCKFSYDEEQPFYRTKVKLKK